MITEVLLTEELFTHWPMSHTMLCIECDTVFKVGPAQCPACTSESFVPLRRFLKPTEEPRHAVSDK